MSLIAALKLDTCRIAVVISNIGCHVEEYHSKQNEYSRICAENIWINLLVCLSEDVIFLQSVDLHSKSAPVAILQLDAENHISQEEHSVCMAGDDVLFATVAFRSRSLWSTLTSVRTDPQ